MGGSVIRLYDEATDQEIGQITEEQFQFLQDQLEEESSDDDDYYLNRETVELLAARGADPALLHLLRDAMGSREDLDVRWVKDKEDDE